MRSMYLGSEFHRYWSKCGHASVHPDDRAYLGEDVSTFELGISPWPFDGTLEQAKVVFCLANPSCGKVENKIKLNEMIEKQRSGEEALPYDFDVSFEEFYKRIVGPIDLPVEVLTCLCAMSCFMKNLSHTLTRCVWLLSYARSH